MRALVRDPDSNRARHLMGYGKEVSQGNLDDPDSLMRAMEGVYGGFSLQPDTANEIQQGVAVIETAKRQDVSHLVYRSVGLADEETGIPHFESKVKVEEHLRSMPMRLTPRPTTSWTVLPGLVPGIHVLKAMAVTKTGMAGTSPAMTDARKQMLRTCASTGRASAIERLRVYD